MLYWYVQNKRIDAPLEWSEEPIWRFFTVLHDGVQEELITLSPEEHEFLDILHPRLLRRYSGFGLRLNSEQLDRIVFRETQRLVHLQRIAHNIHLEKSKKVAIKLGAMLWKRMSDGNRNLLQNRILSKTVWWRRAMKKLFGSSINMLTCTKRSELLEAICMEFNCLSEIDQ